MNQLEERLDYVKKRIAYLSCKNNVSRFHILLTISIDAFRHEGDKTLREVFNKAFIVYGSGALANINNEIDMQEMKNVFILADKFIKNWNFS